MIWLLAFFVAGQDVRLTHRSAIDGTDQPYRVYVPSSYDGSRSFPLVVAMHGTGGDENTLFDQPTYGTLKPAAEKHGAIVVSPLARGVTEYRGIGEADVFEVLADVKKRYRVDEDRVYLTGHSMGGTGAAYIALHHPDRFAAAAPLAAAYGWPWLAENGKHVPMLWIAGEKDAGFYHRGVQAGVDRMRALGNPVTLETIPGGGHSAPVQDFDRVFAWLLRHKRVARPAEFVFVADTPRHGDAYGISIREIEKPGAVARVTGRGADARLDLTLDNVAAIAVRPPGPELALTVNGRRMFRGKVGAEEEVLVRGGKAVKQPRRVSDPAVYRRTPVSTTSRELGMEGIEPELGNWIADALRTAAGADIALFNRQYYRGLPLPAGQVDVVDLIQANRPFDQYLVLADLKGSDILEILDANLDPGKALPMGADRAGASRQVLVSGMQYTFRRGAPAGKRIASSSLDPDRVYKVALEGQVVERETILLAGRFGKLDYRTTGVSFTMALYGHAARAGRIEPALEGRVMAVRE